MAKSRRRFIGGIGAILMNRSFACILAIAGWYLLYPPATHNGNPDSYTALSHWHIDGSYGTAADCHEAHYSDLNALQGLEQNSRDWDRFSSALKPAGSVIPTR